MFIKYITRSIFGALLISAVLMSSCTKKEKTISGVIIGAGTGAAIGGIAGNGTGAAVGGILGGLTGGLIGNSMKDDDKEKKRRERRERQEQREKQFYSDYNEETDK